MSQYLLSVHSYERDFVMPDEVSEDMQEAFRAVDEFNASLQASGAWVFAGGLVPPSSATTVTVSDGEVLVTDGPYPEAKEYLGGFWIVEAPDLDAALDLAARAAAACREAVEVRPFQEGPEQ